MEMVVGEGVRPLAASLLALEGRRVSLALVDGSRIDDCQLVSGPRGELSRVWLYANGLDTFVLVKDIIAAWEVDAG